MTQPSRTGGQILVDALKIHGVDTAFGVPGESYLDVLDALHDSDIRFIINRQEGGAAFMADAYGKMTGKPGICFVTRGPGATNASIGVHTAFQDSTPMILFIGQVGNDFTDREAFQEIDYRRMYGQMAKWVAQIDSVDRIPEYIARAFQTATSGRQGPVVLALPEDMLTRTTSAPLLAPYRRNLAWPDPSRMQEMADELRKAERPLMLVGGGGWTAEACGQLEAFAKAWNLPTACAFRFQDVFDNSHPNYVGEVGSTLGASLKQRFLDADLVLAVGVRLGEGTTRGYTLLTPPRPAQRLVHVHAGAEELGSVYQADVMVQASLPGFTSCLAALTPPDRCVWERWMADGSREYAKHFQGSAVEGPVHMGTIIKTLQTLVPEDTIYASGAGNFAGWSTRFLRYRGQSAGARVQLAPSSGAMGYGVPAAVAAKIVEPGRTVVCFSGDGDFQMNMQEIGTAVQYGAPVVFIVINNGIYGTIRMHQEMYFPERTAGTDLVNPDFAALVRAYGMQGFTVKETAEFEPAMRQALACKTSSLIEIQLDPNVISTTTTLAAVRAKALAAAAA